MAQVFISYSRKDLSFVQRLAMDLESAGLQVWYDHSSIRGAAHWVKEIEKGIKKSGFVIVVLSPDSKKSEWVEREILYASDGKREIIPLLYRPCEPPILLVNRQIINVEAKQYEENFAELLQALHVDATKGALPQAPFKRLFGFLSGLPVRTGAVLLAIPVVALIAWFGLHGPPAGPASTETPFAVPTTVMPAADPTTETPVAAPITETPIIRDPTVDPTTETPIAPPTTVTPTATPITETPTLTPTEPSPTSTPFAYTTVPPGIDGTMKIDQWKDAIPAATLPLGKIYYLNNDEYLYLLVDLTGDTVNNLHKGKSYDDLILVFDVNRNQIQDSGDVYYSYLGKKPEFSFCTWPSSDDSCVLKQRDSTMTSWVRSGFDISPQDRAKKHKFWELRIDLDEINAPPGQETYMGVASRQDGMSEDNSMPETSDFSPNSFDFSRLMQIDLSSLP